MPEPVLALQPVALNCINPKKPQGQETPSMLKEYPLNGRGEAAGQGPALLGFGKLPEPTFR